VQDGGIVSGPDREYDDLLTPDEPDLSMQDKLIRALDRRLYAPMRVAIEDPRMVAGIGILSVFVLMSTVGISLIDAPSLLEGDPLVPPFSTLEFPLGTDGSGRDMLAQIVHASPAMLKMILAGSIFSVVVGVFVGTVAGYKSGLLDQALMFITDTVLTIPALALIIVLASVWVPKSPYMVGLILGIDNWPRLSRQIRSQVLSIREENYTEASRAMGLRERTILRKDVISGLMPYILINFATSSRRIIFESVGLYYLGILPFTTENWGVMLNQAYAEMNVYDTAEWHWVILPMLVIVLVSMGFILFAQGLDRVFNVRLRARHEKTTEDAETVEQPQ